jgi:deoxyribodipyrimidine photo-lyase
VNALVWFRSDLRTDDNGALAEACRAADNVSGLFLVTPGQWRAHDWGARKQLFVWRHVLALRERLAALGVPLWVRVIPDFSAAAAELARFARERAVHTVYANAEYAVDEVARDRRAAEALAAQGTGWRCLHDATVLAPGTVRTQQGAPFRVYSPFRRAWLAQVRGEQPDCVPAPAPRPAVDPPPLPDWQPPAAVLDPDWWPVGEAAARERLADFVAHRIDRYDVDRDFPARDGTSRLSPYLASGVLSVRRCIEAALAHNHGEWDSGSRGVQVWLGELVWREFYTHILAEFPRVSRNRPFRPETDAIAWRAPGEDFQRWCEGRTGFPLVDAAMRQLHATGWMHNRLRMVTAMFLSKYLLIDWRHGERFFCEQLVDCELGANNGGWQWSASTGTDAAPYFRVLSPLRQAERFDADGAFVRRYLPGLATVSTRSLLQPGHPELLATGYPAPMVELKGARERVLLAFRALDHGMATETPR